ncbi:MAG: CBS domain-containing protein [Deltaproteobacteria bacterium]|nr:CBS domain-containing protein [Deltaproteobacteria bacterium]
MNTDKVKDLMVPLDEYATVKHNATLYEAVLALERVQEDFDRSHKAYQHRAVLVYDDNKRIVGKISQLDVLTALEPKYGEMGHSRSMSRVAFSPQFLKNMMKQYSLLSESFEKVCRKARDINVKEIMYTPSEGEYVDENSSLREAIHQFIMGHHQSLLVTRGEDIVGVLRLTDVFKAVFQVMKTSS